MSQFDEINNEIKNLSNYEGNFEITSTELIYTDKPLLDFRFIIQKIPIEEYKINFAKIICILLDSYSVKAAENYELNEMFVAMQRFHFLTINNTKKVPINLIRAGINDSLAHLELTQYKVKVQKKDVYLNNYGPVLWEYLHCASIIAESSTVNEVNQSIILHLDKNVRTEVLYTNEEYPDKVRSTYSENSIFDIHSMSKSDSVSMGHFYRRQKIEIFLNILKFFNNALLCSICRHNYLEHKTLQNIIMPAFLLQSTIGPTYNFHNLVNMTKAFNVDPFPIDVFLKKYNLILTSAIKIYLNKTLVFNQKRHTEEDNVELKKIKKYKSEL